MQWYRPVVAFYYSGLSIKNQLNMNSKVTVTADAAGNVVVPSINNPEYGYVRVEQVKTIFDDKGFVARKPISAIINGTVSDLKSLGWTKNQVLDGKIIIKESTTPFSTKNPEADLKIAGKTGIICKIEGSSIYRKTLYTTNTNVVDVVISHDNIEEIKSKYAESMSATKASALEPSADFKL